MEKRKLVLTIIGVVILAMVIMVYIYFSGASSWIMFFILQMKGTFITMYIFRMHMTGQRNMHYM